ncbi:MAG: metal ABC transporter permease [Acidimicrobiales bacterium]
MMNAWLAGTCMASVAGVVGFFAVLRGSAFAAHALPNGAFAGAAGASLIGVNAVVGLGVFSVAGAVAIAALGRRARQDVAVALAIVTMLGLGALFLSWTDQYGPQIFALLFGELLGVSNGELVPIYVLGVLCMVAVAVLYRPLMLSSITPEIAAVRGLSERRIELLFLLVIALTTSMAVPVVGSLLIFTLLIGPAAAARCLTDRPLVALGLSVALALVTVWAAIAVSYWTNAPVGFVVGSAGAVLYGAGRIWMRVRGLSPAR